MSSDIYAARRETFGSFAQGVTLYMLGLGVVWLALAYGIMIADEHNVLYLDQARYIGHSLPHTELTANIFTQAGFMAVAVLSVACLTIGWLLAYPFVAVGQFFGRADSAFRLQSLILGFVAASVALTLHIAWLFTNVSYGVAWRNCGIAIGVVFVLSLLFGRKK